MTIEIFMLRALMVCNFSLPWPLLLLLILVPIIGKKEYLVKVHNGVDSENLIFITAQNNAMLTMQKNNLSSHVPLLSKDGNHYAFVHLAPLSPSPSDPKTRKHCLRLFEWLGGKMLCDWDLTDDLIYEVAQIFPSYSLLSPSI